MQYAECGVGMQNARSDFQLGLTRMVSLSFTTFDLDLVRVCLSGAALSYGFFIWGIGFGGI